LERIY